MFRTPVFDEFDQVMVTAQQGTDGSSEMVGIAPSQYQVETTDQAGNVSRIGEVDLTQGSAVMDPRGGEAGGSILLTLVDKKGGKLPTPTWIVLRSTAPGTEQRQVLNDEGRATFKGLPPDEYHFIVLGNNRLWQTVRIEEGEKHLVQDRPDHHRLAAGETATLKVVVSGTAKSVEGVATRDGKPMAGAMIVLVPVDAIENVDLFRRDQSDLDGTFVLPDVPAGRYIVIAIADGWKLEWSAADILARFLAKGVPIEIPANERESVHIHSPVIVQDR